MNSTKIIEALQNCVKTQSRFEIKRNYLPMSRISECPQILCIEYLNGKTAADYQNYSGAFLGYTFEDIMVKWLIDLKIINPTTRNLELSALNGKFKGHIDGLTNERVLIEIKSVNQKKFERIVSDSKVPQKNFLQVQTYLFHGNFDEAIIFYVCRETMRFAIKKLNRISSVGQRMTEKAEKILKAIDENISVSCECGYCK